MSLLVVNSLAAYCAWGIISSLIPVIRSGSRAWRLPAWLRALAISGIAWTLYGIPARYVHALACAAIVIILMTIALRLGAALPEPYTIILPSPGKRPAQRREMRGFSPADQAPARRVPRLD